MRVNCNASALTKPEFIEDDIFKTIILLKAEETTQITTQITREKILALPRKNPSISRKKLAEVLGGITEDGVKYHLEKLKEDDKIERVGGTRGRWRVLDN